MELLYAFESIRVPFLDTLMSLITRFGEEMLFMVVALLFFWCINKKQGYYLLSVCFTGTIINQFLKLLCRIPRPWVLDKNFTIVESARAAATGYSFPSGHTQCAAGLFGGIARFTKHKWLRWCCVALCLLVPVSRMYLGVHTPLDVGVAFATALIFVFCMYPLVNKMDTNPGSFRVLLGVMSFSAIAYLAYVRLASFPADIDLDNFAEGTKNAYSMLGAVLGTWCVFELDTRLLHFDVKAVWWAQIIKLLLGFVLLLGIKEGLKSPLNALLGGNGAGNAVRYFLMVLFAGAVWPLTFRFFGRLGVKTEESAKA